MLFKADLQLNLDIRGLEVEADSEEDFQIKLNRLCEQIYQNGTYSLDGEGYVKDYQIEDVEKELESAIYTVSVSNISYDAPEEEKINLPQHFTFKIDVYKDTDIEEEIAWEIEYNTGYEAKDFTYKVTEKE